MKSQKKIILTVVGMSGSGKSEASEYLAKKTGWPHIHIGHITIDEIKRRGIEPTQANERIVREDLRRIHGMDAYAKLSLAQIRSDFKTSSIVLQDVYSWEEYVTLKKEFGEKFLVLAIYASPKTRIERMSKRAVRGLSAEEVLERDRLEIENSHKAGPIAEADFTIVNESTWEEFHHALDELLKGL